MGPDICYRLREITENSSGQINNGFGSCNNSSVVAECAASAINGTGASASTTMGSSGVYFANYGDHSSQNSVSGASGPIRQHYLHPKHPRMGRRVSDGGPYVTAYKLFIEKRAPQLTQIRSNTNIDKSDSTGISSASSVKMLLQEKKSSYGVLPNHKEWLYKQVREGRGVGVVLQVGGLELL